MQAIVWAITLISAVAIIGLVLIQHGKGADVGAAFGSGSAGSLFGATGAANFLSRTTKWLSAVFFIGCLILTYISTHTVRGKGVLDRVDTPSTPSSSVPQTVPTPTPPAPASTAPSSSAPVASPSNASTQVPAQSTAPSSSAAPSAPASEPAASTIPVTAPSANAPTQSGAPPAATPASGTAPASETK